MLLRELFSHLVGHFRHLVGNFRRCKMKMVSGLNIARIILSKKRCSSIPFDSHMISGNGTWQSEMEALMGKSWWNFHCYVGFPGCVHWTWDVSPPCARRGIYKVSGGVSGGNLEPVQCSPVSGRPGRLWPKGLLVVRPFRQAILTHGVNWTRFRSTHVWYILIFSCSGLAWLSQFNGCRGKYSTPSAVPPAGLGHLELASYHQPQWVWRIVSNVGRKSLLGTLFPWNFHGFTSWMISPIFCPSHSAGRLAFPGHLLDMTAACDAETGRCSNLALTSNNDLINCETQEGQKWAVLKAPIGWLVWGWY